MDKFSTCARTRPFGDQFLTSDFYVKEHTKPIFKDKKILTLYANDAKKQADLINEYFYDQFSAASAYSTDIDFANDSNFIDFHFDPDQISNILKGIDTNKSPCPDGITGTVLKKCSSSLSYPLSILFNISFASGQLPQDWKVANVVPVHKKGDKSNIENYRPISLTSLVMKVMEKIVRDELYSKCKDLINDK